MLSTRTRPMQFARAAKPHDSSWFSSAVSVAAVVLLLWGTWYALFFARGHDARDLLLLGDDQIRRSTISSVIRIDPTYHYQAGYDGQFCYFIALDPLHAYAYMDKPNYRYTRILYPMTARLLALGQPQAIPYTLFLVNLFALAGGTYIVARWLLAMRRSPWLALFVGLSPGLVVGMQYDLNEPLAYMLAALGLALYTWPTPGQKHNRTRWVLAGFAFAAAGLTRETTLFIPLAIVLTGLLRPGHDGVLAVERWRAIQFGSIVFAPFALYKAVLFWWLGASALPADILPAPYPFAAYLAPHPRFPLVPLVALVCVILPGLLVATLGIVAWYRARCSDSVVLALLLQFVILVVFIPASSVGDMISMPRVTAVIPSAALFCLPQFDQVTKGRRLWLAVAGTLWLLLLPWLLTNFAYW